MYLQWFNLDEYRGIVIGESDGRAAGLRFHSPQPDIRDDFTVGTFQPFALVDRSNVARPQVRLQVVGEINDEAIMDSGPNLRLFQVRIHSRKDHAHRLPSRPTALASFRPPPPEA